MREFDGRCDCRIIIHLYRMLRPRLLFAPIIVCLSCTLNRESSLTNVSDSIISNYISAADSFSEYDTLTDGFLMLKAYHKRDTQLHFADWPISILQTRLAAGINTVIRREIVKSLLHYICLILKKLTVLSMEAHFAIRRSSLQSAKEIMRSLHKF